VHHEGIALHEGAQVHHHVQLRRLQRANDRLLIVLGPQLQRPLLQLLQQLQPRLRRRCARGWTDVPAVATLAAAAGGL
jgi:hypothetical protein